MISIESNIDWEQKLTERINKALKELNINPNAMSYYNTDIETILKYHSLLCGTVYEYEDKPLIFTGEKLYDFETLEDVTEQYEDFRNIIIIVMS